jgi:ketosteroid isomerase-like protein
MLVCALLIAACEARTSVQPDFDAALERHLGAIQSRDLEAFVSTLTSGDTLYTIFPDGEALTTPAQAIALHKEWFADRDWVWEGEVVQKIVGTDLATALMKYDYRDAPESAPRSSWLVLVFRLEDGEWRLVHDQNTRIGAATVE